jgi:tRNA1Val (adenine37-N6)-methyltransferase
MKVSTDACIQGAWTPAEADTKRALDVGTGTGLLALMLAQRQPEATIDAIELNEAAAKQAADNVACSPFANRINVVQGDASLSEGSGEYDLIICNPPFFKGALLGPDVHRNAARHVGALDSTVLTRIMLNHLAPDGKASFLWPVKEFAAFIAVASRAGLYLTRQLNIRHRCDGPVIRIVAVLQRKPMSHTEEELTIRKSSETYTDEFAALLRPFYLKL